MNGGNLIGYKYSAKSDRKMRAFSPLLNGFLEDEFSEATSEEIDEALQLATAAFPDYRTVSPRQKARFLEAIAEEILGLDDRLVERASLETGLPQGRIIGERGRTVNQLRLFADLLTEGSWVEASIDTSVPGRQPLPKPDIRKMLVPLGPVVVFTASNFPLAFSTAGGDSASALAAGNPVIVKAHESHLGTNALVAGAIRAAAERTGMPEGVFSSLNGTGPALGQALARHPLTKAIAFTGSFAAGKALFDTAANREEPIPVFAEMGSVNPVILLPEALKARAAAIAEQYAVSVTLGAGQFCTNPGLLIALEDENLQPFISKLGDEMQKTTPAPMLNERIAENYEKSRQALLKEHGILLESESVTAKNRLSGRAAVASVNAADFLNNPRLHREIFGPFTLIVRCQGEAQLLTVVRSLEGQLTATLIAQKKEIRNYEKLIEALQDRVGRLIFNGVPTGVEVCPSMQHGGPFPASTDSRFTSVGTGAIRRFARPVAFQNWPPELLPAELKDENPLNIWRLVNGEWSRRKLNQREEK